MLIDDNFQHLQFKNEKLLKMEKVVHVPFKKSKPQGWILNNY